MSTTIHFEGSAAEHTNGERVGVVDLSFAQGVHEVVDLEMHLDADTTFRTLTLSGNATPVKIVGVLADKPIRLRVGGASTAVAMKVPTGLCMQCSANTLAIRNESSWTGGNHVRLFYGGGKGA